MTQTQNIMQVLSTLHGMSAEISLKKKLLSYQLGEGPSSANLEKIRNTTIVLNHELDSINVMLDLIDNLTVCFRQPQPQM